MLEKIKISLRITTNAFDGEITDLINAALADLSIAGVTTTTETDPLVIMAVTTYCRVHFGEPPDFDRLKKSYDNQKAQLQTATGYTNWGEDNG